MAYASYTDVESRLGRTLTTSEQSVCNSLLDDAAVIIDTFANDADGDAKKIVSCRMVMRSIGSADAGAFPLGTSQGSMAALGYSQSFTVGSGGGLGELYLSKLEKQMLGIVGNKIGSHSPVEDVDDSDCWMERWWESND